MRRKGRRARGGAGRGAAGRGPGGPRSSGVGEPLPKLKSNQSERPEGGASRPEPVIPGLPITQQVANQRGPWCSTSLYLGKCGGGCALAAEGKHSTVPARRGRDRERTVRLERERAGERGRERGRGREGESEGERKRERKPGRCKAPAATPLRHGPRQPCTLRAARRAHWSWLCTKDPLYAHTPLHLHQCTPPPPPPPPPDNCWEKIKTPTPTVSNKRQPRAPAIATAEKCSIARSFPRTEQNLKGEHRPGRAGASPHPPAASITTPSGTLKVLLLQGQERNAFLRSPESGQGKERAGCGSSVIWFEKKGTAAFFVVSREIAT